MRTKSEKQRSTAIAVKSKAQKQELLLTSILSLLDKYGSSLDLRSLYREFILTLMGNHMVSDACYFSLSSSSNNLLPALAYGRVQIDTLLPIAPSSPLASHLINGEAQDFDKLPKFIIGEPYLKPLSGSMSIAAPVQMKGKLIGILFLGPKISGKSFTKFDLELIRTLCAASAVTFSNARLLENVKSSIEEVERLLNLRVEMISRISHEFRTPLTVIENGLQLIEQQDESQIVSKMIRESVDRFAELIDSLLMLNSEHNPESHAVKSSFKPSEVVSQFISNHDSEAHSKELSFRIRDLPEHRTPTLRISRDNFATIVDRLLENAIRYANESTVIDVRLEILARVPNEADDGLMIMDWRSRANKTLAQYRDLLGLANDTPGADFLSTNVLSQLSTARNYTGPFLVVRVSDTGIGIPRHDLEFIAEPFRQASNSPDQQVKGKALGLAVVQKVLSESQGLLCCKSEEGIGTTFSVFIPLAK